MGLGSSAIKLYLELWQKGLLENCESVIEMGSQDLQLSQARFESLLDSSGLNVTLPDVFHNLKYWPADPRVSARHFYELLGLNEYSCIDLNEVYGAIPHDLNQILQDESIFGQFDLVTDHGTNEHVFNIAETYRTMHSLCREGGIISVHQCVYGGNGYHNFDLSFFEGMAAANDYEILFSSFVVSLHREFLSTEETRGITDDYQLSHRREEYHIPLSKDLLNSINWSRDNQELGICYVFRKKNDQPFQYAYPGSYQVDLQGHSGYQLQFLPDPPSRTYIKLFSQSEGGLQQDILDGMSGKTLAKHLFKKASNKFTRIRS